MMKLKDPEGWKWTPIRDIKIGDRLSHWGYEDVVERIVQTETSWEVTVYDELLQKTMTHQYKLSDELLIKINPPPLFDLEFDIDGQHHVVPVTPADPPSLGDEIEAVEIPSNGGTNQFSSKRPDGSVAYFTVTVDCESPPRRFDAPDQIIADEKDLIVSTSIATENPDGSLTVHVDIPLANFSEQVED